MVPGPEAREARGCWKPAGEELSTRLVEALPRKLAEAEAIPRKLAEVEAVPRSLMAQ